MAGRPSRAFVDFPPPVEGGAAIRRDAPIEWLTTRVGFADVPGPEIGSKVRCVCVWDGHGCSVQPLPVGSPVARVMDAVLASCLDMTAMGAHFEARLRKLEGFAAGEKAEEQANAPILAGPGSEPR